MRCHSLYARKNHSRFHDDLDHDRSDQRCLHSNCCYASRRTSKDRLASISLRRDHPDRCGHNWPSSTRSHHDQIQMRRTSTWTYFKVSSARVCTPLELRPAPSCICPWESCRTFRLREWEWDPLRVYGTLSDARLRLRSCARKTTFLTPPCVRFTTRC